MYSAIEKRAQAMALKDDTLTFGDWCALHSDHETALLGLINVRGRGDLFDWPKALGQDVRDAVVAAHTVGAYQSGGWALGVISNGASVLPYVPSALRRVGFNKQADDAQRSLDHFPKDADFSQPDSDLVHDTIVRLEKSAGYNDFLAEIEDNLPSSWEKVGTPQDILDFASKIAASQVWAA